MSAPLGEFTGRQESPQGQDVIAGHSVFGTPHSAGVAGDVAADRRVGLGGRIGRVEPSGRLDRFLNVRDAGAGLDINESLLGIETDRPPSRQVKDPAPSQG